MSVVPGSDLIALLLALQKDNGWGTIDVDAGTTHTCIYVANGKPVFAEEGTLTDALGRLLVREGVLTTEQYVAILERMTERIVGSEPMRFGEVAVELGFLTVQQVHDALAAQVQQKVIRALSQPDAKFTFRASRDWAGEVGRFTSDVEPLVLHVAATFDEDRVNALLRPDDVTVPRLSAPADEIATTLRLGTSETRWLSKLDGSASTRDLLDSTEVEASPILCALVLCGMMTLEKPAVPSLVPPAPPARSRTAPRRRLIRPAQKPSAPDVAPESTAESREKAAVALKQLWESRRDKEKTAPPVTPKNPQEARLLAEGAFQHGVAHLHGGNFARAVEQLKRAVELVPDAKEYALHAQWAEYATQTTLDETQRRKALVELGAAASAALGELPDLGFAHYVLGQVRLFAGNEDQAKKFFRRARQLDPALVDAERQLRILELRKSKDAAPPTPVAATAPAEPTTKRAVEATAAAPSRARTLVLAGGLLVVVIAAAVVLWPSRPAAPPPAAATTTQKPQPAPPPPTVVPSATPSIAPSAAPSVAPSAAPSIAPSAAPSIAPSASQSASDGFGELSTGPAGRGHRLLVDGHSIGEGPGPFRVRCGAHTVQIGSAGSPKRVEVPCGGTLRVD